MVLPLKMPHIRHTRLDLHIVVIFKVRTTRIWPFGCGFACANTIGWVQTIIWYHYFSIIIDYN